MSNDPMNYVRAKKVYNVLQNGLFAFLLAARKKAAPLYVEWAITSRCNLNCAYCYASPNKEFFPPGAGAPSRLNDLPLEKIFFLADEFYKAGTRFINIMGGEPALRSDLPQIVEYLFNKGFSLDLNTNGTLLDRHLPVLKYFNRIIVSLEGSLEAHNKDRGRGSYEKIIDNLDLIKKERITTKIKFNMTLTRNNITDLEDILKLAEKYDSEVFFVEPCDVSSGTTRDKFYADKQQIVYLYEQISQKQKTDRRFRRFVIYDSDILLKYQFMEPYQIYYNTADINKALWNDGVAPKCYFGSYMIFLDADGTIYPCNNFFGKIGANCFQHGVAKAYKMLSEQMTCKYCHLALTATIFGFFEMKPKIIYRASLNFLKNAFK